MQVPCRRAQRLCQPGGTLARMGLQFPCLSPMRLTSRHPDGPVRGHRIAAAWEDAATAPLEAVARLAPVAQIAALAVALAAAFAGPARAEKADRDKPMTVEADRDGTIDTRLGVTVFSGNAVISQGTMVIRAERVEVRDPPAGPRTAVATGVPGRPASFRQKREGLDEHVEAQADRIDYDGGADTLRFSGNAVLRRLRAGSVVDEAQGALIVWDNRSESLSMRGGTVTPVNPGGRVRVTLGPAKPASAPASSSAPTSATPRPAPAPLKPSRTLGEPR